MPTPTATLFLPYSALDDVLLRGPRASQPAASAVTPGTLYAVTDEGKVEQSTGAAWTLYGASGSGGGGTPLPYVDLLEGVWGAPPADTARLAAADDHGYTIPEVTDSAGHAARPLRDALIVVKVAEPGGVARGQVVYVSGASGANNEVKLAKADTPTTLPAAGWVLDAGALNAFVRVLLQGQLTGGLDTSAYAEGTRLFVSATTAGAVTATPPAIPAYTQRVGIVTRSHAVNGEVLVLITATTGPLDAGVITSGTIDPARLPATMSPTAHHATHETGGTDALAALDAGVLTTGTLPDARLSTNVARRDTVNVFTQEYSPGVRPLTIQANLPLLAFNEIDQLANQRLWRLYAQNGLLVVSPASDDELSVTSVPTTFTRAGDLNVSRDLYEKQRVTPLGHWIDVGFNAADFYAPSATWAVTAGQLGCYAYTLVGKLVMFSVTISGSTLSGTPPVRLRIRLPSAVPAGGRNHAGTFAYGAATTYGTGVCSLVGNELDLLRDLLGSAWPVGTVYIYLTYVYSLA